MSRPTKTARLVKRQARYRDGKLIRNAIWVVKDSEREVTTGITAGENERTPPQEAEQFLAAYISEKYSPLKVTRDIDSIPVADVLLVYLEHREDPDGSGDKIEDRHLEQAIERLNEFFGSYTLGQLTTAIYKAYVKSRPGRGGARRDLEMLRAAINHHKKENLHRGNVSVWLPEKGESRSRWLTRDEAAAMIWKAYRHRDSQIIQRGPNKGQMIAEMKGRASLRHVARFILMGVYTGTRAGALASAAIIRADGKSYVDLEAGLFYRLAIGKRQTKKRQPIAPIPRRLLAHMRRWVAKGIAKEHFVEWNGKPISSVKSGFATVVEMAGIDVELENVTPHTLRHTAATWLMQAGVDLWEAAGYLGMTPEVLMQNYGHHHPSFMKEAADGVTSKKKKDRGSSKLTVVK